jgi:hypothetical protein
MDSSILYVYYYYIGPGVVALLLEHLSPAHSEERSRPAAARTFGFHKNNQNGAKPILEDMGCNSGTSRNGLIT